MERPRYPRTKKNNRYSDALELKKNPGYKGATPILDALQGTDSDIQGTGVGSVSTLKNLESFSRRGNSGLSLLGMGKLSDSLLNRRTTVNPYDGSPEERTLVSKQGFVAERHGGKLYRTDAVDNNLRPNGVDSALELNYGIQPTDTKNTTNIKKRVANRFKRTVLGNLLSRIF